MYYIPTDFGPLHRAVQEYRRNLEELAADVAEPVLGENEVAVLDRMEVFKQKISVSPCGGAGAPKGVASAPLRGKPWLT